jgi:tripartite-type tricarboxylate transporter receptor subunit TctC
MIHRRLALALVACLAAPLAGLPALAQTPDAAKAEIAKLKPKDFPSQPIEITVVYPAGGGMDINARQVAKFFEKWSGERAIVNNRTGGAGLVGHTWLATQAPKDGHSVGVIASLVFGDAMLRANNRWSHTDLEPLAHLNSEGLNLVVNAGGAYKDRSLKEILAIAKEKSGTVRIGTVPGTMYEYMIDQMESASGAKLLRVPFQGGAPGIAALLGNNTDIGIGFWGEISTYLEAKRVTPVAVSSLTRSPFLPDAPTLGEVLGADDISWTTTRWVALPKGVPADRKAYLVAVFSAVASDPDLHAEFKKLGAPPDPKINTPELLAAHLDKLAGLERDFYIKTGRMKQP